eukprot:TRINITY_DN63945_c0_g1_i1.p1 TRINITY_DN63945_c0_g1~~TRINITY_DN63945_c0_g1_i1.p1  ORF type:complete len:477 (-),score=72.85 TRINITY_DN63945_c0_g1_i1:161-1591(-)
MAATDAMLSRSSRSDESVFTVANRLGKGKGNGKNGYPAPAIHTSNTDHAAPQTMAPDAKFAQVPEVKQVPKRDTPEAVVAGRCAKPSIEESVTRTHKSSSKVALITSVSKPSDDAMSLTCFLLALSFFFIPFLLGGAIAGIRHMDATGRTVGYAQLEAPSIAVCGGGSDILSNMNAKYDIYATKFTSKGRDRLYHPAVRCSFEGHRCMCLDLQSVFLADAEYNHTGALGSSEKKTREHIVVRTTLTDSSTGKLKVGLYSSASSSPTWVDVPQFHTAIGSVRLESALSFMQFLRSFVTGSSGSPLQHQFAYSGGNADTSAERGEDMQPFTRIGIEYESFLVVEKEVPKIPTALYSLILAILITLMVVGIFQWSKAWWLQYVMGNGQQREEDAALDALESAVKTPRSLRSKDQNKEFPSTDKTSQLRSSGKKMPEVYDMTVHSDASTDCVVFDISANDSDTDQDRNPGPSPPLSPSLP